LARLYKLLKSESSPWPEPVIPLGVDVEHEAGISRGRMYPVTLIYGTYLAVLLVLASRASLLSRAAAYLAAGLLAWTLMEYLVHRYILHVAFPNRGGLVSRTLHKLFDASHGDHHANPFDGYHINGHLDTVWIAIVAFPLSWLAPPFTASMLVAGIFVGYVVEEWAHHAMHFDNFDWGYFQYVRRRHLYHHSRHGALGGGRAYGITSDFWDKVFGTRIPAPERDRLSPSVGRKLPDVTS
jgi:sterol desaturase/sphingolipid hydroxylase (fatty acid hydroxylase superfamily)